MYKFLIFFLAISVLSISCNSSKKISESSINKGVQESNKLPYTSLEKALLWKISGNELTTPSYLFGTIHIIPSDEFFLPNGTLEALGAAKKVVFEIDMADMNDMGKQMGLLSKAFMNDDLTLKDLYTEKEYTIVKNHFEKMGIPLFFMERMKPMLLTVFASGDIDPSDLQNGKAKSYEMEFFEMAKDSKKETGGLETIEYQMSIFDSIPYDEQADMLLETIEMGDEASDSMDEMIKIYKDQDIEGMQAMFKEEGNEIEGHEDVLLVNRNKNWIPIMSEMMNTGTHFFAVGAGHLGGPFGVIHLLKEAGYSIVPVK